MIIAVGMTDILTLALIQILTVTVALTLVLALVLTVALTLALVLQSSDANPKVRTCLSCVWTLGAARARHL